MAGRARAGAARPADAVASGTSTLGEPLPAASTRSRRSTAASSRPSPGRARQTGDAAGTRPAPGEGSGAGRGPVAAARRRAGRVGEAYQDERQSRVESFDQRLGGGAAAVVSNGSGFLLAFMLWSWVALPFLDNGMAGVKKMLMAKFFNRRPDGSFLP